MSTELVDPSVESIIESTANERLKSELVIAFVV